MSKKAHTPNNCPGCGTPLKNAGAPIGDDYCPNDDCRHRAEEIKRQISAATKAHRRDKQIRDAAPDLLEALEKLLAVAEMTTFSGQFPQECENARAALTKATGE